MEKEKRPEETARQPANDNGGDHPLDPRIPRIAQAIGRYLAREQIKGRILRPANDDAPHGSCPKVNE